MKESFLSTAGVAMRGITHFKEPEARSTPAYAVRFEFFHGSLDICLLN